MGFVILLVVLLCTVYLDRKNKSSVVPILFMTILSPEIKVGNVSIDSLYIYATLLFLYICTTKKFLIYGAVNRYITTIALCLLIYTISWLLFSRIDFSSLMLCLLGGMKTIIILIECWTLNFAFKSQIESDIFKLLILVLILNVMFVIFQSLFYEQSLWVLKNVFLSSSEYDYIMGTTYAGHYTRYGGLFRYPMHMGVFCAITLAFVLSMQKRVNLVLKYILIALCLYCGIMSSTKSFFIGVAVIYCFYIIQVCFSIKNKKDIIYALIPLVSVILIIIFQNKIIQFVENIFGAYAAFYARKVIEFFNDMGSVFDTRFGETGAIVSLFEVVKENFFFGVGPSSINGESIMDNAVLVILHNGGIFALSIIIYYFCETINTFYKNKISILVILAVLACGMGFQIWIASSLTIWACYYFDVEVNKLRKKK